MKMILVPTNFSKASDAALKVACSIAQRKKDILVRLSHVYHVPRLASLPSEDYGYDVRFQQKLVADIHEKLNVLAKKDFVKGLKIETQLIPHMDVNKLIHHKDNKNADLIICGIEGNIDWHDTIEGTNTEIIMRNALCPVLTVNAEIKEPITFDNIVFASDFTPETHIRFPILKKVLNSLGGRIHLLKVITPHHFENTLPVEMEIKRFAEKFFLTNYRIKVFNDDSIEKGIHMFAYSIKANLITMETHGRTGFMHMVKGSITESVAHHSELSVLTIKIPEKKKKAG